MRVERREVGADGVADALEDGIVEVRAAVRGVKADKCGAHVRIEERETLAGEVGQEDQVRRVVIGVGEQRIAFRGGNCEHVARPVAGGPRRQDRRNFDEQAVTRMGKAIDGRVRCEVAIHNDSGNPAAGAEVEADVAVVAAAGAERGGAAVAAAVDDGDGR